jgi:hypothetical protein
MCNADDACRYSETVATHIWYCNYYVTTNCNTAAWKRLTKGQMENKVAERAIHLPTHTVVKQTLRRKQTHFLQMLTEHMSEHWSDVLFILKVIIVFHWKHFELGELAIHLTISNIKAWEKSFCLMCVTVQPQKALIQTEQSRAHLWIWEKELVGTSCTS